MNDVNVFWKVIVRNINRKSESPIGITLENKEINLKKKKELKSAKA